MVPQSGAAAGRTAQPLERFPPAVPQLTEPVAFLVNIEYDYRTWWKGGRVVSNHDSRSPFFSLLSLNYSKAIISFSFHYQIVGAKTR